MFSTQRRDVSVKLRPLIAVASAPMLRAAEKTYATRRNRTGPPGGGCCCRARVTGRAVLPHSLNGGTSMSWTIERRHRVAVVTMTTNPVNAQNRAFFADLHDAF